MTDALPPAQPRYARWLAWGSLVLWLLSIFQPVAIAEYQNGPSVIDGASILVMGWLGMLMFQFGWWANLVLILAFWAVLRRHRAPSPRVLMVLAVALALLLADSLFWTSAPNDASAGRLSAHLIGFYLWGAAILAAIAALFLRAREVG